MSTAATNGVRRKIPAWLGPTIVYAISISCLVWVYRDFDWHAELPKLRRIHWIWIVLAVTCDILVYVCQAWRWNILLSPIVKVPLARSVRAVYIGLFANEVLPLRSGEVIRCYLQHHWSNISFPAAISSAIIERLIDGVWLIVGFFVTTFFVDLPNKLEYGARVLAGMVLGLALVLAWAVHRRDEAHDVLAKSRWLSGLRHLVEGLHHMGRGTSFFVAAVVSLGYLALQVVPIFAMIRGYGEQLSFGDAAVVLVVLRLGTIIPGPPGNIGFFNAFAVLALKMLGVDEQSAKGLSGLMFFMISVPLLLGGCVALLVTGAKIGEIHRSAQSKWQEKEAVPDEVGRES